MVGRSVGRRGVGRRRALSDGGQQTDESFYIFLEPPFFISCPLSTLLFFQSFHIKLLLQVFYEATVVVVFA